MWLQLLTHTVNVLDPQHPSVMSLRISGVTGSRSPALTPPTGHKGSSAQLPGLTYCSCMNSASLCNCPRGSEAHGPGRGKSELHMRPNVTRGAPEVPHDGEVNVDLAALCSHLFPADDHEVHRVRCQSVRAVWRPAVQSLHTAAENSFFVPSLRGPRRVTENTVRPYRASVSQPAYDITTGTSSGVR